MRRVAARIGIAILLVVLALLLWQNVLEGVERREPVRGRMVDAGGHRLRMIVSGPDRGPTVILECGIGGSTASSWGWEQRAVAKFARVVSYDRAGLGASDPGPMPRDGNRLVDELHTALEHAGFQPPFVFVGHSYGGLLARLFTERYPGEVAGAVLVESSYASSSTGAARPVRPYLHLLPLAPWAARLGLMRLGVALIGTDARRLPEPERAEQSAYLSSSRQWMGIVRELEAWGPLTNPEAAKTHGFGSRPLAVLTAETSAHRWSGWSAMQEQAARLSTDSIHEIVPGATHGSAVTDSASAAFVSAAIEEVVTAVRERRPLRSLVGGVN
ncbi:MAG TPA: alpha/beta hydrolase [Candidatus Sulfotelmatobacter sp.]|nr:alpha/beta hydrolase [Candidatus Sulfotelmatobacter sp.]